MSEIKGIIGAHQLTWLNAPRGNQGSARVQCADGKILDVSWKKDSQGIWIELFHGTFGFDIFGENQDDGRISYRISQRLASAEWNGVAYSRAGDSASAQSTVTKKKGFRIKAQMPGKMIRVLAAKGDRVEKGQPLLVMEAMKMENEIRAPESGVVSKVSVVEGQAVDSGAELLTLDPA